MSIHLVRRNVNIFKSCVISGNCFVYRPSVFFSFSFPSFLEFLYACVALFSAADLTSSLSFYNSIAA